MFIFVWKCICVCVILNKSTLLGDDRKGIHDAKENKIWQ